MSIRYKLVRKWLIIIGCSIPYGVFIAVDKSHLWAKKAASRAAEARTKRANKPKPLSQKRRRLSGCTPKFPESTFLQQLPLEIRLEIYKYVVGGEVLHLGHLPGRIGHTRCIPSEHQDLRFLSGGKPLYDAPLACLPGQLSSHYQRYLFLHPQSNQLLALLKVCRQVYVEAVGILYSTNKFAIEHVNVLIWFSRSIVPRRLQIIRNLRVAFATGFSGTFPRDIYASKFMRQWKRFWHIIAVEMTGLLRLSCYLDFRDPYGIDSHWLDQEAGWVQPMSHVRGLADADAAILVNLNDSQWPDHLARAERLGQYLQRNWKRPRLEIE